MDLEIRKNQGRKFRIIMLLPYVAMYTLLRVVTYHTSTRVNVHSPPCCCIPHFNTRLLRTLDNIIKKFSQKFYILQLCKEILEGIEEMRKFLY